MDSNGEQEDRASRRIRKIEDANCLICYEERPILTNSCCGQGACTTCLGRCLIDKQSCPFCRAAMTLLPTSSPVKRSVHDSSFRTLRRRRTSRLRVNSISDSISLATPAIHRRISGNNSNMINSSGSSNFPDSISFPTRYKNSCYENSSRTRCSFPFWKYLRRMWCNHGNLSEVRRNSLLSAEENFIYFNASSDDEDSSSANENLAFSLTSSAIVRPTVARTERVMMNRWLSGCEDFSTEDDNISWDGTSYVQCVIRR